MRRLFYKIKDPHGLHARPAGLLVREAMKFSSEITLEKGNAKADMKKLFSVMSIGVKCGDEITVRIEGSDEEFAEKSLLTFMEENI